MERPFLQEQKPVLTENVQKFVESWDIGEKDAAKSALIDIVKVLFLEHSSKSSELEHVEETVQIFTRLSEFIRFYETKNGPLTTKNKLSLGLASLSAGAAFIRFNDPEQNEKVPCIVLFPMGTALEHILPKKLSSLFLASVLVHELQHAADVAANTFQMDLKNKLYRKLVQTGMIVSQIPLTLQILGGITIEFPKESALHEIPALTPEIFWLVTTVLLLKAFIETYKLLPEEKRAYETQDAITKPLLIEEVKKIVPEMKEFLSVVVTSVISAAKGPPKK